MREKLRQVYRIQFYSIYNSFGLQEISNFHWRMFLIIHILLDICYKYQMKYQLILVLFAAYIFVSSKPDLFIGTGGFGFGCGSNSPAVQVPFSFVRLGPDTTPTKKLQYFQFQHFGGYHDSDKGLRAFSHMHLVGAGVIDMGILGILPRVTKNPDQAPRIPEQQMISFYKDLEYAEPGYYKSQLQGNIKVQLTSSQRCGAHRYTYFNKKNKPLQVLIMPSYLLQKKAKRFASAKICGKKCLQGQIWVEGSFGGRFGGYTIHYHLEWVSEDSDESIFLYDKENMINITELSRDRVDGNITGAIVRSKSSIFEIYVGLSYVSIQNAQLNYMNEIQGKKFEEIKEEALKAWNRELGRFDILAIDTVLQTKIDTAIYRTLLTPTIFEDSNGDYVSFSNNGSIAKRPQNMQHIYTDMSLWDVHRSQMPWLLFHDPYRFKDIAMSLVLINKEGGYMPKWPFAQGATGCMIGAHATTVLADWILKQAINDPLINISEILGYMMRNANQITPHDSRSHIDQYISMGYLPAQSAGSNSCSQTLEYSYNDFGISQVAKLLNQSIVSQQFQRRSKFYKNVWNNKTKFFQPRFTNQSFKHISELQRINIFSNNYVEGDAWHYRFYAPHDPEGLIQLFGGKDQFVKELSKFFSKSFSWPTLWLPNPYYWAGNQHDLFSVWLFPFANRSDLTEQYSRKIIDEFYGIEGNGLPGNDDYATMSAWLVFGALGFYPVPSTQNFVLGSPYIHYGKVKRRIQAEQYSDFRIRVYNNNRKNSKVKQVRLNKQQKQKVIKHQEMKKQNAYLQFWMH